MLLSFNIVYITVLLHRMFVYYNQKRLCFHITFSVTNTTTTTTAIAITLLYFYCFLVLFFCKIIHFKGASSFPFPFKEIEGLRCSDNWELGHSRRPRMPFFGCHLSRYFWDQTPNLEVDDSNCVDGRKWTLRGRKFIFGRGGVNLPVLECLVGWTFIF